VNTTKGLLECKLIITRKAIKTMEKEINYKMLKYDDTTFYDVSSFFAIS